MKKADVLLRVRLLSASEGGRDSPIDSKRYGCPIMTNDMAFDGRIVSQCDEILFPGKTYDIAIKFRLPAEAKSMLAIGSCVKLWEGRVIAEGKVIDIYD